MLWMLGIPDLGILGWGLESDAEVDRGAAMRPRLS